jgi:anti-sigma factor RsiW
MDCDRAARLLVSRIDGELEAGVALEMEAHLGSCPACRAREEDERSLRALIRAGAPALEARPASLSPSQLLFRSRRAFAEEASLVRSLKRVAGLAAALLLTSGLVIALEKRDRPAEDFEASIGVVASSFDAPLEVLIDQENSIMLGLGQ